MTLVEYTTEAQSSTALSPFLNNVQFAWDATSLGLFKRCPKLYDYIINEGWVPKGRSIHLSFGIVVHEARRFYKELRADGLDHDDALHQTVRDILVETSDWEVEFEGHHYINLPRKPSEKAKSRENLVRTMVWYFDHYQEDPVQTVVLKNGELAMELSFRINLDYGPTSEMEDGVLVGQPYVLCGHLDEVVSHLDNPFILDTKTTYSTPGSYYFEGYDPDNQMSLYPIAGEIMLKSPVKGVMIDVIQVTQEFSRFVRGFTFRNPMRNEEWLEDLEDWLRDAEDCALRGRWRRNDTACDKYGGCEFREVCRSAPHVRDQMLKSKFERGERWNPLKPR